MRASALLLLALPLLAGCLSRERTPYFQPLDRDRRVVAWPVYVGDGVTHYAAWPLVKKAPGVFAAWPFFNYDHGIYDVTPLLTLVPEDGECRLWPLFWRKERNLLLLPLFYRNWRNENNHLLWTPLYTYGVSGSTRAHTLFLHLLGCETFRSSLGNAYTSHWAFPLYIHRCNSAKRAWTWTPLSCWERDGADLDRRIAPLGLWPSLWWQQRSESADVAVDTWGTWLVGHSRETWSETGEEGGEARQTVSSKNWALPFALWGGENDDRYAWSLLSDYEKTSARRKLDLGPLGLPLWGERDYAATEEAPAKELRFLTPFWLSIAYPGEDVRSWWTPLAGAGEGRDAHWWYALSCGHARTGEERVGWALPFALWWRAGADRHGLWTPLAYSRHAGKTRSYGVGPIFPWLYDATRETGDLEKNADAFLAGLLAYSKRLRHGDARKNEFLLGGGLVWNSETQSHPHSLSGEGGTPFETAVGRTVWKGQDGSSLCIAASEDETPHWAEWEGHSFSLLCDAIGHKRLAKFDGSAEKRRLALGWILWRSASEPGESSLWTPLCSVRRRAWNDGDEEVCRGLLCDVATRRVRHDADGHLRFARNNLLGGLLWKDETWVDDRQCHKHKFGETRLLAGLLYRRESFRTGSKKEDERTLLGSLLWSDESRRDAETGEADSAKHDLLLGLAESWSRDKNGYDFWCLPLLFHCANSHWERDIDDTLLDEMNEPAEGDACVPQKPDSQRCEIRNRSDLLLGLGFLYWRRTCDNHWRPLLNDGTLGDPVFDDQPIPRFAPAPPVNGYEDADALLLGIPYASEGRRDGSMDRYGLGGLLWRAKTDKAQGTDLFSVLGWLYRSEGYADGVRDRFLFPGVQLRTRDNGAWRFSLFSKFFRIEKTEAGETRWWLFWL